VGQDLPEEDKKRESEDRVMRDRALRVLLTPGARDRLSNVRVVKPDVAKTVEDYLLTMGSQGRLKKEVTDEDLKQILSSLQQPKREFKINYK
jgi:programmed cell death protein 5